MQSNILLTDNLQIKNVEQLNYLLSVIFHDDPDYVTKIQNTIHEADPQFRQINSVIEVVRVLKQSFKDSLNWDGFIPPLDAKHLLQLTSFEETAVISQQRYSNQSKPRQNSVFWPNPAHSKHPSSRFNVLPYVQKHPLIDKNTPIGSAGSCFAIEIARALQEQEFNYVITERADDTSTGVFVDNYTAGDQYAHGSFNSGIQFNTMNFRHLAEKAFGSRDFKRLVVEQKSTSGHTYYMDPYREDIFFTSEQAYADDYHKHRNAIREALSQCEVFILTPGLNECWELKDGTVMARNPRLATYPYAKHKTLTVAENVENLEFFFNTVKQHNPNFKLILSLSPVPFLATGRAETHHVIEANCHSKATLRVAIDEVVQNNADIYYLPSYEYVSYCSQKPWMEDDRHVQRDTVRQIIQMFSEIFYK
jgi:GSCFA family